jgi:hypothetical protein
MDGSTQVRLRNTIVAVALSGMELAWLFVLLTLAATLLDTSLPIFPLLILYLASFALCRGLDAAGVSRLPARVLTWAVWPLFTLLLLKVVLYPQTALFDSSWPADVLASFAAILDGVQPPVFVVLAGGPLYWLGVRLAHVPKDFGTVVARFQFGLIIFAASMLLAQLAGLDQSWSVGMALVFVGLGLIGAAASRTEGGGGYLFSFGGGPWWSMLLLSVGLILILGLFAGAFFVPELAQIIARGMRAGWHLLERLLDVLAGLFSTSSPETMPTPTTVSPLPADEGEGFSLGPPAWLVKPGRIVYGILFAGLVLFALWRAASQLFDWMRRRAGDGRAEMESISGGFRADLARLLRRVVSWFGRLFSRARLRRTPQGEPPQTATIRRLYVDMLRWGAESGVPRLAAQTPFEYQHTLAAALPGHRAEVAHLTEAYVRAKYGAQPPTREELDRLRHSRRSLRHGAASPISETEEHGYTGHAAF